MVIALFISYISQKAQNLNPLWEKNKKQQQQKMSNQPIFSGTKAGQCLCIKINLAQRMLSIFFNTRDTNTFIFLFYMLFDLIKLHMLFIGVLYFIKLCVK